MVAVAILAFVTLQGRPGHIEDDLTTPVKVA